MVKLLDVDLLRNQSKWRSELNDMRFILSEAATAGGYPADHMAPWRAFLDRQLYKIKAKYYRELRKFICIPENFRGLSEFSQSTDNNNSHINKKKVEFLFTRLLGSLEQFQDWVVLGSVNLDELVDSHCRDLVDFERNFKVSILFSYIIFKSLYFFLSNISIILL
ncbi:unnamed protein product [Trichobilharzia regenti]|nr:unnamed protein product [Trichobilharzia regenti]